MNKASTTETPAFSIALPTGIRVAAACGKSDYAPAGVRVTFNGTTADIESTDTKVAVRLRCNASGDVAVGASAIVPVELLKPAKRGAPTTLEVSGQICVRRSGMESMGATAIDKSFPPVMSVFPETEQLADDSQYHFVRFNPQVLTRMFEAMGADEAVCLFIPRNVQKPIVAVNSLNTVGATAIGVAMPLASADDSKKLAVMVYERTKSDDRSIDEGIDAEADRCSSHIDCSEGGAA